MSDKPEPCQNDKCIMFDKDAVMGINCLDGLNFPCRLHSTDLGNPAPRPSEVYDRIQGYLRVIQEKDAIIAELSKPRECDCCRKDNIAELYHVCPDCFKTDHQQEPRE